jgi:ABC-type enterobactin transport system permease subunit
MTAANTRPLDQQRAGRLLLAWLRNDKVAIDAVLSETTRNPIGTPDLLFATTAIAAELAVAVVPDSAEEQIESALLRIASEHPDGGG